MDLSENITLKDEFLIFAQREEIKRITKLCNFFIYIDNFKNLMYNN